MTKIFGEIKDATSSDRELELDLEVARLRRSLRSVAELADAYARGTGVNGFSRIAREARESLCAETRHE